MTCKVCDAPLRSDNRGGYCGAHRNLDPAYRARQRLYERTRYAPRRAPTQWTVSRAVPPDDVMIDRIVHHGRSDGANRAEKRLAALRVMRSYPDWSAARVAEQVGVCARTIERLIRRTS